MCMSTKYETVQFVDQGHLVGIVLGNHVLKAPPGIQPFVKLKK